MPQSLTENQHSILIHALGLHRSEDSYRNCYFDEPDSVDCKILIDKGMMVKGTPIIGGLMTYYITSLGRKIAERK